MVKKILLIGIVCLSVTAFLEDQASGGCCCNPRFCAKWLKGSLESYHTALVKNFPKYCTEETGDCPWTKASAFGVIHPDTEEIDLEYCANFDPDDPSSYTDCGIPMQALCDNPAGKKPPKKWPKGTAVPFNYWDYTTTGGVLFECQKNGQCKQLLTLDFDFDTICKDNWILRDHAVVDFIGVQDMCPGGFDSAEKNCCATDDRQNDVSCEVLHPGIVNDGQKAVEGKPTRYVKRCYMDLTDYTPGETFTYCCAYCVPKDGGGYECPSRDEVLAQCNE